MDKRLPPRPASPRERREDGTHHHNPRGRQESTDKERPGEHSEPEDRERKARQQEARSRSQPSEGWPASSIAPRLGVGTGDHRFEHSALPFSGITATRHYMSRGTLRGVSLTGSFPRRGRASSHPASASRSVP